MADETKTLDVTSSSDLKEKVNDVKIVGNPDAWQLICKASSQSQGWLKSTKAMEIFGLGTLVQVSTQQGSNVAESIAFVPFASIETDEHGNRTITLGKLARKAFETLIGRLESAVREPVHKPAKAKETTT